MVCLCHSSYAMQEHENHLVTFITRTKMLTLKLMRQGFVKQRLITVLIKFYGRYPELVSHYTITISKLTEDIFGTSPNI